MITVNKFQVSADMKTLLVKVTAATGKIIDSFTIQNEATYLDSTIDLTSKLLQTSEVEEITLYPEDLSLDAFNGIYFATFGTDEVGVDPVTVAACNFTQFFYSVNDFLTKINGDCLNCDDNLQNALVVDLYLEGLKNALMVGKYTNAVVNFYSLKRLCSGNIDSCTTGCTSGYGILDGEFVLA
jgi:hypothetical protein